MTSANAALACVTDVCKLPQHKGTQLLLLLSCYVHHTNVAAVCRLLLAACTSSCSTSSILCCFKARVMLGWLTLCASHMLQVQFIIHVTEPGAHQYQKLTKKAAVVAVSITMQWAQLSQSHCRHSKGAGQASSTTGTERTLERTTRLCYRAWGDILQVEHSRHQTRLKQRLPARLLSVPTKVSAPCKNAE